MREAILHLTGYRHRDVYDELYRRKREITMNDLRRQMIHVSQNEWHVSRTSSPATASGRCSARRRSSIAHRRSRLTKEGSQTVCRREYPVATGTKPSRPSHIPFDGQTVFDSDEILRLDHIPRSMIVVGGGVIGIEYAIMFATLGVKVTVVDGRERLLEFCDREIIDTLLYHARSLGMVFRLGENVVDIRQPRPGLVAVELESGKRLLRRDGAVQRRPQRRHRSAASGAGRPVTPTTAAASSATRIFKPQCRTSTPSATSSASRRSPAPRWSKAAGPSAT